MSDFVGAKFGRLKIVAIYSDNGKKKAICECDCGNKNIVRHFYALRNSSLAGSVSSCGCFMDEVRSKMFDFTKWNQKRFGRLLVTGYGRSKDKFRGESYLVCLCDCGSQYECYPADLKNKTVSCGCFNIEATTKRINDINLSHGECVNGKSYLYMRWANIIGNVRRFRNAGGSSCQEYDARWDDFSNFKADFGTLNEYQTIRRHDKKKPWCKDNCYVTASFRKQVCDE